MFNTGLKKYESVTVSTFTTDTGLKVRKWINPIWRRILSKGTSRKMIIERYPELDKHKNYIFVGTHSFDEDIISLLFTIDRNTY